MKPAARGVVILLPLAVAACAAPTAAVTLECPPGLRVRQEAVSPPESWRAVASELDHRLASAGFTDGPADERAFLKPDSSEVVKQIRTVTWSFGDEGSDDVWLSCSYQGTSASVTKKVDGRVTRCAITYDEAPDGPASLKEIVCQ